LNSKKGRRAAAIPASFEGHAEFVRLKVVQFWKNNDDGSIGVDMAALLLVIYGEQGLGEDDAALAPLAPAAAAAAADPSAILALSHAMLLERLLAVGGGGVVMPASIPAGGVLFARGEGGSSSSILSVVAALASTASASPACRAALADVARGSDEPLAVRLLVAGSGALAAQPSGGARPLLVGAADAGAGAAAAAAVPPLPAAAEGRDARVRLAQLVNSGVRSAAAVALQLLRDVSGRPDQLLASATSAVLQPHAVALNSASKPEAWALGFPASGLCFAGALDDGAFVPSTDVARALLQGGVAPGRDFTVVSGVGSGALLKRHRLVHLCMARYMLRVSCNSPDCEESSSAVGRCETALHGGMLVRDELLFAHDDAGAIGPGWRGPVSFVGGCAHRMTATVLDVQYPSFVALDCTGRPGPLPLFLQPLAPVSASAAASSAAASPAAASSAAAAGDARPPAYGLTAVCKNSTAVRHATTTLILVGEAAGAAAAGLGPRRVNLLHLDTLASSAAQPEPVLSVQEVRKILGRGTLPLTLAVFAAEAPNIAALLPLVPPLPPPGKRKRSAAAAGALGAAAAGAAAAGAAAAGGAGGASGGGAGGGEVPAGAAASAVAGSRGGARGGGDRGDVAAGPGGPPAKRSRQSAPRLFDAVVTFLNSKPYLRALELDRAAETAYARFLEVEARREAFAKGKGKPFVSSIPAWAAALQAKVAAGSASAGGAALPAAAAAL